MLMNVRYGLIIVDMFVRIWWGFLCVFVSRVLLVLGIIVEVMKYKCQNFYLFYFYNIGIKFYFILNVQMLMNVEILEFVSLVGVLIFREVISVFVFRDIFRVLIENFVLVRILLVRKFKDFKQLCKFCYFMKFWVLNILSIVLDQREGNCFFELIGGRCVFIYFYRMINQECCCSGVAAWGFVCSRCFVQGFSKFMIEVVLG